MPFRDLLLHIDSHPTPTPAAAIDEAVRLAKGLGGAVTALAVEVEIPIHSTRLADYLIGLSSMAEAAEACSRAACREGLARFKDQAEAREVFQDIVLDRANHYDVASLVAKHARTRDLCILPLVDGVDGQPEVAQSVVFNSGRPVLLFREGHAEPLINGPDLVVVAWDGSRGAARAMADAMPILVKAQKVRLLTVLNEKPGAMAAAGSDAQRHLQAHGATVTVDEVDSGGDSIGVVLDRYLKRQAPDLLVMGAYGHSRAQEFLLGGATQHMLRTPPCPVFMSH